MAKIWFIALALIIGAGLWAVPVAAQSSDVFDVGRIQRGGGEASTDLGAGGLKWSTAGFSLNMSTRVQVRFTYQDEKANGSDGTNGRDFANFSIRRAKTTFSGHIYDQQYQYELRLNWAGGPIIEQAFMTYAWQADGSVNVSAGQHKLPWSWEEFTSSGNQQFVERSAANAVFNQNYAKGVWLSGKFGGAEPMLKYWVGVYNGVLRANNDFRNADQGASPDSFSNLVDNEMMFNMRLETHPMGEVANRMNDMRSAAAAEKMLLAAGVGVNWFQSGFNDAVLRPDTVGTPTASGRARTWQDTWAITGDVHFRMAGFSADLAVFWRHTEFHNRGATRFNPTTPARNGISDLTDAGMTFEAAYFIEPERFNVGVRYSVVDADEYWLGGSNQIFAVRPDTTEVGVSANYFVHGDGLKLTLDILYVNQQLAVPGTAAGSLTGIYNAPPSRGEFGGTTESSDNNALWIIRLQLQWIF
jgi:hypothetical protein